MTKKIRVTGSGGGPDDSDIRRTQAAALDMMTQAVAPNPASPDDDNFRLVSLDSPINFRFLWIPLSLSRLQLLPFHL